jgi:hypothetical protein
MAFFVKKAFCAYWHKSLGKSPNCSAIWKPFSRQKKSLGKNVAIDKAYMPQKREKGVKYGEKRFFFWGGEG